MRRQQPLRVGLGQGRHGRRTVAARGQRPGGGDRGLLRPAVVLGRPPRGRRVVRRARADATTSTRRRTTPSTASAGASPTTTTSWPASRPSPPTATLRLGFAISPGLSMDYDDADDRAALAAKVDQVVGGGAALVVLALRRHPVRRRPAGRGPRRADHLAPRPPRRPGRRSRSSRPSTSGSARRPTSTRWPRRARRRARSRGPGGPWSNDAITVADAEARAASLGGRPPLLWDNYPVNDG